MMWNNAKKYGTRYKEKIIRYVEGIFYCMGGNDIQNENKKREETWWMDYVLRRNNDCIRNDESKKEMIHRKFQKTRNHDKYEYRLSTRVWIQDKDEIDSKYAKFLEKNGRMLIIIHWTICLNRRILNHSVSPIVVEKLSLGNTQIFEKDFIFKWWKCVVR